MSQQATIVRSPEGVESSDLHFKLVKRCNIFNCDGRKDNTKLSLVAVSNSMGATFVGTLQSILVFQTDAFAADLGVIEITLPNRPMYISLNSDESLLAVAYAASNGCRCSIFGLNLLPTQGQVKVVQDIQIGSTPGASIGDFAWNPTTSNLFACCLDDGSLLVAELNPNSVNILGTLSKEAGASCLCWSPKGKQLVVGFHSGELQQFQYKPQLQPAKRIPAPDLYEQQPRVASVLWISNFQFAVYYGHRQIESAAPSFVIVNTPKNEPIAFVNYDDITFGSSSTGSYYFHLTSPWNLILVAATDAVEVNSLYSPDGKNWQHWMMGDSSRAELPLTETQEETFPLGMAIDLTSQNAVACPLTEAALRPMPRLLFLTSDGRLCLYNIISLLQSSPNICAAPSNPIPSKFFKRFQVEASASPTALPPLSPISPPPTESNQPPSYPAPPTQIVHANAVNPQVSPAPTSLLTSALQRQPMPSFTFSTPVATTMPSKPVPAQAQVVTPVKPISHAAPMKREAGEQNSQEVRRSSGSLQPPKPEPEAAPELDAAVYCEAISDELNELNKELRAILSPSYDLKLPPLQVFKEPLKKLQALDEFQHEVDADTVAHAEELLELKLDVLQLRSKTEDSKLTAKRINMPLPTQRRRDEQLDPLTMRTVRDMVALQTHIQSQITQIAHHLDQQWEEHQLSYRRKVKQEMKTPWMEDVYKTIELHRKLMTQQSITLDGLQRDVKQRTLRGGWQNKANSPARGDSSRSAVMSKLAESLLGIKIEEKDDIDDLADISKDLKRTNLKSTSMSPKALSVLLDRFVDADVPVVTRAMTFSEREAHKKEVAARLKATADTMRKKREDAKMKMPSPQPEKTLTIASKPNAIEAFSPVRTPTDPSKGQALFNTSKINTAPKFFEVSANSGFTQIQPNTETKKSTSKNEKDVPVGLTSGFNVDPKTTTLPQKPKDSSSFGVKPGNQALTVTPTLFDPSKVGLSFGASPLAKSDSSSKVSFAPVSIAKVTPTVSSTAFSTSGSLFSFTPSASSATAVPATVASSQNNSAIGGSSLFGLSTSTSTVWQSTKTQSNPPASSSVEKSSVAVSPVPTSDTKVSAALAVSSPAPVAVSKGTVNVSNLTTSIGESKTGTAKASQSAPKHEDVPTSVTSTSTAVTTTSGSTGLFSPVVTTNTGSLFGSTVTTTSTTTAFSNIFSSTKTTSTASTGSFGALSISTTSSAASTTPVQSTATSIFAASAAPIITTSLFGATSVSTTAAKPFTAASTQAPIFGGSSQTAATTGSMFGTTSTPSTTTSIFGSSAFPSIPATTTGSIFGSTFTQPAASSNLFGAIAAATTTTPSSVFGAVATTTATTSLFGSVAPATTAAATSVFGSVTPATTTAATATTAAPTSVFGSVAPAATTGTTSVFGSTAPATTGAATSVFASVAPSSTTGTTSVFGSTAPATTAAPASVFGSVAPAATTGTTSVFGSTAPAITAAATSVFGSVAPAATTGNTSVFGSTAPATTAAPTSVFGSVAPAVSAGTTSVFGSVAPATTATTSVFGSLAPATASSAFGADQATNLFAQVLGGGSSPADTGSIFGQTTPVKSPFETSGNIFASTPATTAQSLFGSPSPSVFGQNNSGLFGNVSTPANIFGQSPSTTTNSIFGQSPFGSGAAAPNQSPFSAAATTNQSAFGASAFASKPIFGQSTFGQAGSSIFGGGSTDNSASIFGGANQSAQNAFQGGSFSNQGGAFSGGTGSVAQSGFGAGTAFSKPAGGFGGAPTFGSPPSGGFGGAPTFGGAPAFGQPSAFGSLQKPFGAAQGTTAFGQTQGSPGFETLANQNSVGFGNLAQNQGFGSTFTTQPSTFGNTQQSSFGGNSFSSWR